jgi:hypothetical protein
MAELKRIEEELPSSELASDDIPAKQPEGPKLVKGQEPKPLDGAAAVPEPMPLFSEPEIVDFRSQWRKVQTAFVDEPRRTVEDADKLVAAGDAAPSGRFRQRAVWLGKALGQR